MGTAKPISAIQELSALFPMWQYAAKTLIALAVILVAASS
jgi:hypothetical protein